MHTEPTNGHPLLQHASITNTLAENWGLLLPSQVTELLLRLPTASFLAFKRSFLTYLHWLLRKEKMLIHNKTHKRPQTFAWIHQIGIKGLARFGVLQKFLARLSKMRRPRKKKVGPKSIFTEHCQPSRYNWKLAWWKVPEMRWVDQQRPNSLTGRI